MKEPKCEMPFCYVWVKTNLCPEIQKNDSEAAVFYRVASGHHLLEETTVKKSATQRQFSPLVSAGKRGSLPSKTSDTLGTDNSERAQFWSKVDAAVSDSKHIYVDSLIQYFWFQTKEIRMKFQTIVCWKMPKIC